MSDRYTRYSGIVDPEKLKAARVTIIGIGAIGRQVAIQLATMGVGRLDLWDFDLVGPENFGTQGYRPDQLGLAKVTATGQDVVQINPEISVSLHASKFGMGQPLENIVALCVDSIETRQRFFERRGKDTPFLVDGRMSAETVRVLTSSFGSGNYSNTFFGSAEAFGGGCTTKSTIYSASLAAALMVGEISKFIRGVSQNIDMTMDILSSDLVVG